MNNYVITTNKNKNMTVEMSGVAQASGASPVGPLMFPRDK